MNSKQAWIVGGILAGVLLLWKVVPAAARVKKELEIDANVYSPTFGEPISSGAPSATYDVGIGAAGPPTATDDSHARMLRLIQESDDAIAAFDATQPQSAD